MMFVGVFGTLQQDIIIDYEILKDSFGLERERLQDVTFQFIGDKKNPDRILARDRNGRLLKIKDKEMDPRDPTEEEKEKDKRPK